MKENKDRKWKVYQHYCILSGGTYIGITSKKTLGMRSGRQGQNYYDSPRFWNAIQKYGWDNFEHEILFDNLLESEAKTIEIFLIAKLREYGYKLYNISGGGDGALGVRRRGKKNSKESYEKARQKMIGRKLSDEHKKHLSEARKGKYTGKDNPNWGKHMSEENKEKLRKAHQGENNINYGKAGSDTTASKRIFQFSLDMKFIKEYPSISEGSRQTGVSLTSISNCCLGKQKTAGGFIWQFKYKKGKKHE